MSPSRVKFLLMCDNGKDLEMRFFYFGLSEWALNATMGVRIQERQIEIGQREKRRKQCEDIGAMQPSRAEADKEQLLS